MGRNVARDSELEQLRQRLAEAEATLAAIRSGEVDALVVTGDEGDQIFTLLGAEQPYRVFVESMQQGAITLSPEGNILYANRGFARMIGQPLERVIGSSFLTYISAADRPDVEVLLPQPADRQQRVFLYHAAGSLVPAQLAFSVQQISGVTTLCVVVTDVTEMQERQVLTEALERLKAAQQQLRQQNHDISEARQAAESANAAKDQFLAQLSHELRTPLTPVLMSLSALEDEPMPPALSEEFSLIRRNVELQTRLIDDLLDLSRVITGKLRLNVAPMNLHELIKEVLQICDPESSARHLTISMKLRAANPLVYGDSVRIRQILWNLLRNAVKFTPDHGRITINTEDRDGRIIVSIRDTGIGIASEALPRIFSPFEQANHQITRRFGGMGLGLAISQRLAQMHGGEIVALSDGEGRGSTFILDLPSLVPGDESVSPVAAAPEEQAAPVRGRILLVEDHDDTRALLCRLLSRHHHVTPADSVTAAKTAADTAQFDLVVSDLGLPDGSGHEVMVHVAKHQRIPGIALSGFGTDNDIERSRKAGFTRHLVKPIAVQELLLAIDQTLRSTPRSGN